MRKMFLLFKEYPMSKSTLSTNPRYFEAIIQLRPYDTEVFAFIEKAIYEKHNSGLFISRIEELKTGVDIYVSSQRFARTLGQKLKRHYPQGELIITQKLHTRDRMRSRDLSRATVLFRLRRKEDDVSI